MSTPAFRSGWAALIGRPNVGKSTLLNQLAGEKLSIVSPKPQTTRHRVLGVVTSERAQIAFVDTPGIHKSKGALNRHMIDVALGALQDVDVALFLIGATDKRSDEVDAENRAILKEVQAAKTPGFLVINKIDQVKKPLLLPLIDRYRQEYPFVEVVPVSALKGEGTDRLVTALEPYLPEGEAIFPPETHTDQTERMLVAELVREQVFLLCRDEIPYSTAVLVEVFDEAERAPRGKPDKKGLAGLIRVAASIIVERESQKGIVVGQRGQMLKRIGTEARHGIEAMLGTHLFLSLRVKVEPRWSERADGLRKLGYE